jgi:hypothetical protein
MHRRAVVLEHDEFGTRRAGHDLGAAAGEQTQHATGTERLEGGVAGGRRQPFDERRGQATGDHAATQAVGREPAPRFRVERLLVDEIPESVTQQFVVWLVTQRQHFQFEDAHAGLRPRRSVGGRPCGDRAGVRRRRDPTSARRAEHRRQHVVSPGCQRPPTGPKHPSGPNGVPLPRSVGLHRRWHLAGLAGFGGRPSRRADAPVPQTPGYGR